MKVPDRETESGRDKGTGSEPRRHWQSFPLSPPLCLSITLALLPLLYFYPAVTGEVQLMPGDGWTQNLGVRVLTGRLIGQGILPLWNPYIFAGMPLLASVYPGALYPPNWLFALLSPGVAMNVVVVTTFHLALIGSYLYARRIGMTRLGALATGIIFSFGGYMVAHVSHTSRIAAAAWLPWVLLAIESLYQQARWRWVMLGALFVALQLFAGEPQMTCYTALLGGAYALFSLTLREERERRWRFAATAVMMAIGGAWLSAIQLLPAWELLQQGERAQLSYGYFASYSLPPRQLWALIFPYFFGGASRPPFTLPYWGQWNVNVVCGYAGMLGWLLGLMAVFSARRSRLVWFWAGMAGLALLLACGDYLPFQLNHLLYRVPFYNLFRGSYRHLFEFTFALAALAGLGLSAVMRMERTAVRRAFGRSVTALAAIVVGALIASRFFGEKLGEPTARPALSTSTGQC